MVFHRLAKGFLRGLMAIFLDYQVEGLDNVPKTGPLILAINHMKFLDPVVASALSPRDVVTMAKAELFHNPFVGLIFRLYGAFPVRRGEIDRSALGRSVQTLRAGKALLMAPEGTRGKGYSLKLAKDGMAYLALRENVPILPVAISGTEKFWGQLKRLRRAKVRLTFGEAFLISAIDSKVSREELCQMTREAMYRLAALLPEEYRGAYSDLSQATEKYLRPYSTA
jgi:1-acyl-sn-glycerol-3-phosphate acyltransferase